MTDFISEINYDKLIEKSLKQVVIDVLKIVEKQGLPGENHFYITFKTDNPKVIIPAYLKNRYPDNMTIAIQMQFRNLIVLDDAFSVELNFNGHPETLLIPFDSITYFADPHAKFALSFSFYENGDARSLDGLEPERKVSGETAEIISFDSFRNKKK